MHTQQIEETEQVCQWVLLELPAALLAAARKAVIRRGAEYSLENALAEGLSLWVEQEKKRPEPEGYDAHLNLALRGVCCRMLGNCFEQLQAATTEDGGLTDQPAVLKDARQAGRWLVSDDQDHPLSFLNCCFVMGFAPQRGRLWARPILEQLDIRQDPPAAAKQHRFGLVDPQSPIQYKGLKPPAVPPMLGLGLKGEPAPPIQGKAIPNEPEQHPVEDARGHVGADDLSAPDALLVKPNDQNDLDDFEDWELESLEDAGNQAGADDLSTPDALLAKLNDPDDPDDFEDWELEPLEDPLLDPAHDQPTKESATPLLNHVRSEDGQGDPDQYLDMELEELSAAGREATEEPSLGQELKARPKRRKARMRPKSQKITRSERDETEDRDELLEEPAQSPSEKAPDIPIHDDLDDLNDLDDLGNLDDSGRGIPENEPTPAPEPSRPDTPEGSLVDDLANLDDL